MGKKSNVMVDNDIVWLLGCHQASDIILDDPEQIGAHPFCEQLAMQAWSHTYVTMHTAV